MEAVLTARCTTRWCDECCEYGIEMCRLETGGEVLLDDDDDDVFG